MPGQFQMETQEQSEWCWAAVALSIDKYFNPKTRRNQCDIAKLVLGNSCDCGGGCNEPKTLIEALQKIGRPVHVLNYALPFERIRQELSAKRPVCARIRWNGGGAHFAVLTGYEILKSQARHVDVADPFYPDSTVIYEEFRDNYHGDGKWVDTYLLKTNLP